MFEGLKVLDVSTWIAAPVASTILADMGAEVIKIEQPELGDGYRNFALLPFTPTADVNYTWALDNRNKRSLALNLKSAAGMEVLHRLVADCDIYITNHPQAMRRQLGLTYEDLKPLNERMIYASLTAYGEEGPERDREGFDLVAYWSRSGLMDMVRPIGGEPAQSLPGMGDHPTGIALYACIVTALLRRERSGKGGIVHTSLLANGLWSASCLAQAVFANADFGVYLDPDRAHFTRALYQAADGRWLQFTMLRTVEEFDQFIVVLGLFDLLADDRFATPESRFEHGAELTQMLREVILQKPSAQWMQAFTEAAVPAALVGQIQDLPSDAQVAINNMTTEPIEDVGMSRVIRDPLNVEGARRVGVKKSPELGEHSQEILAELGYSSEQIAGFLAEGVI